MRQPKTKLNSLKMAGVAALVLAVLYVAVQLYLILGHSYKQETAILYQLSDSVTLDGVVVFGEQEVQGSGNLGYLVEDGTRVVDGTQVAEIYTDPQQAAWREKLTRVNNTIALLEKAQNANSSSDIEVASSQAQAALYDLLDTMDQTALVGLAEDQNEYLLAESRVNVCTGLETDYSQKIAELSQERDSIQASLGQPQPIYAGSGGYFISAQNSKFLTKSAEELDEMTPAQLQAYLQKGAAETRDVAGKVITSYHWNYYAVCDLATAEKFQNASKVTIRFPGKSEEELPATVESVTVDQDGGLAKVVLSCEYTNEDMLKLVQQTAQVSFATYTGLRIDKNAMHIVDGEKGVYVKYGSIQRFRKIYVLYENEDYILVPADQSNGSEVKLYDEIIVEGTDLQDGNLL